MELVGGATSGPAAVTVIREARPQIAVVDLSLPGMTGIELIRQIAKEQPEVKVLVLTLHDEFVYVQQALEAGVHGYLVKRSAADELTERSGRSRRAVPTSIRQLPERRFRRSATSVISAHVALSEREAEVLKLVAQGFSNKQIACHLALSIKTVETYKARAAEKLGLRIGRTSFDTASCKDGCKTTEMPVGVFLTKLAVLPATPAGPNAR